VCSVYSVNAPKVIPSCLELESEREETNVWKLGVVKEGGARKSLRWIVLSESFGSYYWGLLVATRAVGEVLGGARGRKLGKWWH
jgi:hypothetical protein